MLLDFDDARELNIELQPELKQKLVKCSITIVDAGSQSRTANSAVCFVNGIIHSHSKFNRPHVTVTIS